MKIFSWFISKIKDYRNKRVARATVRYMFPAVLGTILLLSASSINSIDGSYVYLNPNTTTVAAGEILSIEVGVSANTPINAVDIQVEFPSDKVEVFSIDRGQSVLTIWTEDPIVTSNSIQFVGGTFKRGFIGEHEVATIKFRALETGQYELNVEEVVFVAGDGTGKEVPVEKHVSNTLSLFNYDENTTAEEIKIAVESGIPTDLNNDGKVTLQDISAFMGAWNQKTQLFDFNNDGKMTFKDFSIILADYFFY